MSVWAQILQSVLANPITAEAEHAFLTWLLSQLGPSPAPVSPAELVAMHASFKAGK